MAPSKTEEYLANRRSEIENADYDQTVKDAILTFLDAYNPDVFHIDPPIQEGKNKRESTLATSSRLAYASTLHQTAQQLNLISCSARELNELARKRLTGEHEDVKDDGLTENTVHQNQIAWRSFYRFHANHQQGVETNVDPDDIGLVEREKTSVDERDMFTAEEVQQMRAATQNKRDRAVLEMLIFTGQRHEALRTLEYRDVRPDAGESGLVYLNDDTEGLKGANGKRPLLGAQKAAREWKRAHPTQEPSDAFFTHVYDWTNHDEIDAGDPLSKQSFGKIPKHIAERAGVEKKANPHQFRHYFTQTMIRNYGMSFDTVRHLLGHAPDSRELERTYQHLIDDDHIESAETSMGMRNEEDESLTPSVCPVCDEPLDSSWNACPNCGQIFSPKAEQVVDEIKESATEDALSFDLDEQTKTDITELLSILEDPQILNQLVTILESADDGDELF